jgi:hypothetical protein
MDADKSDEPPSRQVRGLGKQWFFCSLKIHNPQSTILNHQSFSSLPLDLPPSPLLFSQQYSKLAL